MEITTRVEFSAAHRLMHHKGKCANIHGHNYIVEVTLSGVCKTPTGMFVDFGDVRQRVAKWVDDHWDHALLLNSADPLCQELPGWDHKLYEFDCVDPTAEVLADTLLLELPVVLHNAAAVEGCVVESVTVHENSRSKATCRSNGPTRC